MDDTKKMDQRSLHVLEYEKIIEHLAKLALSGPGRQLCLDLQPKSEATIVKIRQDETEDAAAMILEAGLLPLGSVSDIEPSVERACAGSSLSCAELLHVGALLRTIDRLKPRLPDDGTIRGPIEQLIVRLEPLKALNRRIDQVIAGEDALHDHASDELFNIRKKIRTAQNDVKESLSRIIRSHANALQEQLVTLRGDRYVVPVKSEHRGELPGLVHDTSSSGATLFIEPLPVVELNNKIRELMGLEREEIERILLELTGLVADNAEYLRQNQDELAQIDFIQARGRLALDMNGMRPRVNTVGHIRLVDARHPMIPRDRVVPISFELGYHFKTLVITGPNTGGKTVTLKTCGLLCLMTMAGLQIPAREGSEMALFKDVLADIGDEQSIEQDLSTFSSHMHNLVQITRQASPDTLILLDELGSGTDPSEGAALAMAILEYLRKKKCLTVATTHYKELKGYALQTPGVENACCEFDTRTLQPTYRLLMGVPGVSNAFVISSRLGLDPEIIEQARQWLSEEGIRFEDLVRTMEQNRQKSDVAKREAQILLEKARMDAEAAKQEREALEDQKKQLIQAARQEARELYAESLQEIERLLNDIRSQIKEEAYENSHHLATKAREQIRTGMNRVERDLKQSALSSQGRGQIPEEILIGETYTAPALNITGKILEGPDARGYYVLQSGAMKVTVPKDTLRLPSEQAEQEKRKKNKKAGHRLVKRKSTPSSELKLLGQTVEEATLHLDRFIDDAILAGINTIRIVHGKGTGALRSAVQQQLKNDTRVASFRLGSYGEGDSGVTIAELK